MKVVLFGATGMVGQGVLRECLNDPDVELVLSIGRSATGTQHPKLRELVHKDLTSYDSISAELRGFDACFFCLGISSNGLDEAAYRAITYDITLAAARALVAENPGMAFAFVSGSGTDATEKGRIMWARVKGKAENDLQKLPFGRTFMFRPGIIQPLHGITSRTKLYRVFYTVFGPLLPALKLLFPRQITSTEAIGQAMLRLVKRRAPSAILENPDINQAAAS